MVCERKEHKQGKRNVLKGKIVVRILEVLEELERCEGQANLKTTKQRPRIRRNQAKATQQVESTLEKNEEDQHIEVLDVIEIAYIRW